MNFKKPLALALSTSIALNTTFAINSTANRKIDINEISYSEKIIRNIKSAGNKVAGFTKKHPVLTTITGLVAVAICLKDPAKALYYNHCIKNYEKMYRKEFVNTVEENSITPRQEGTAWCSIACLTGLLHDKGYTNVTQKDIYKKTYKPWFGVPFFECNRTKGVLASAPLSKKEMVEQNQYDTNLYRSYLTWSMLGTIYQSQFDQYVKNISNNSLRYQLLYVPYNTKENDIANAIKNILSKYNKISILDGYVASKSNKFIQHFVNIVNIDNNIITVEDPQIGLSRREEIIDFVRGHTGYNRLINLTILETPILSKINPGIMIGVLTENENLYKNGDIDNVFYVDPENCKEDFEELKQVYESYKN